VLDAEPALSISAVSYVELVQGMRDKGELRILRQALSYWSASIVHTDEAISARACFLVEQHALSHFLAACRCADRRHGAGARA